MSIVCQNSVVKRVPKLYGQSEFAKELNTTLPFFSNLLRGTKNGRFPKRALKLSCGSFWTEEQVQSYKGGTIIQPTETLPDLFGFGDIVSEFEISKTHLQNLIKNGSFPAPDLLLNAGPIWLGSTIHPFFDTYQKKTRRKNSTQYPLYAVIPGLMGPKEGVLEHVRDLLPKEIVLDNPIVEKSSSTPPTYRAKFESEIAIDLVNKLFAHYDTVLGTEKGDEKEVLSRIEARTPGTPYVYRRIKQGVYEFKIFVSSKNV